jgi:hypothetical protein
MNICNHPEAAGCTATPGSDSGAASVPVSGAAPTTARPTTTTTEWKDDSGQWDNGRIETKIFVFVFSRKFSRKFIFVFAKIS